MSSIQIRQEEIEFNPPSPLPMIPQTEEELFPEPILIFTEEDQIPHSDPEI